MESRKRKSSKSTGADLTSRGTGVGQIYLASLRSELPHISNCGEREGTAPRAATIDEFRMANAADKWLLESLLNKVKLCKCGKPCAYTLSACNACGSSLADVALSYNDNVFMGFIYGIANGKYPYMISLRKQTPEFLCFDDPLSMSVCHMNAIPTTVYVPDLRYLFKDPLRGLELINNLFKIAAEAAIEQFWSNDEFRKRFFGDDRAPSPEELIERTMCGMNFPPSMYQLHLQFIHPPLLPFHYSQALCENHFHHGRFFPLEYLQRALALGERARMDITEDTDISDIIKYFNSLGVNYDEAQILLLRRARTMQEHFRPWRERDFNSYVINGKVLSTDGLRAEEQAASELQKSDTQAMQNYGRPYDEKGKPTGTYYRHSKVPGEVVAF